MCDICNGRFTREEANERRAARVAAHGFTIQVVEAGHGQLGWAYTIGLIEHFGHPELVLADAKVSVAAKVLDALAENVRRGVRLRAGDTVPAGGLPVDLVEVHPAHLRHGIFDGWLEVYSWLPSPPAFSALEVVLPPEAFCPCHRNRGPLLAHAASPLVRPMANRRSRRAARRRRG